MRCWAAIVPEDRFVGERLYSFDTLTLPSTAIGVAEDLEPGSGAVDPQLAAALGAAPVGLRLVPETGDRVALLVAGQPPRLFALAEVAKASGDGELVLTYTRRRFDDPVPVDDLVPAHSSAALDVEPLTELDEATYTQLADRAGGGAQRNQDWFVTVSLPIEAGSAADAVREFWTYVAKLGPRELPAFVWPRGDELAMQAFVLGEAANQDPEDD